MNPPPLPAKKAAKGSEGGGQADVTATPAASTMLPPPSAPAPLADTTPNAQGEEKKPEIAGGKGGGTFLPPPPPKKSGALASGVAKAAPTGASYRPPSWGLTEAPEASGFSLTVLKSGIEVNSISLDNRTHILLGRQQGVVDVLLEHPSISRKHAILQHGQNGALFLFDNGSTHGCSVNKKKIPPKEFHRLHVGDVLKFGESTRLYALEGPEELRPAEYESDNLRNLRLDAGRKQLAVKLAKLKAGAAGDGKGQGDSGEFGISWGFDEDAVADEEDEDEEGVEGGDGEEAVELPDYLKTEAQKRRRRDTKIGVTEESVHKRDAKLFEKLQLKLTKVEHLLTENERITAKEGGQGGLTEGQQAQLARNDKAITGVRLQIEEIEETIRSKNQARERGKEREEGDTGKEKAGGGKEDRDGDEGDDYYDRTAPVVPASARASGSDPASKKAEIRARRFGARDNKSKMTAVVPGSGGDPAAAGAAPAGSGAGDEPVAQSLEALTRRAEVVAEDLERTQAGLVELEAEEAEEAGEAALGDDGAADPLDMFMTENRRKERHQAMSRLTAQRGALLKEQARLKVMAEAARPSMPSLKGSAPAKAATGASAARADAGAEEDHREEGKAERDDKSDTGGAGAAGKSVVKADQAEGDQAEGDQAAKDVSPPAPPAPATMAAPARPGPAAAPPLGEEGQEGGRGKGGADGDRGMMPAPAAKEEKKASGGKRRGTPVGASMLPPPPAKRPQRREKGEAKGSASPAPPGGDEGGGGGRGPPAPPSEGKPKRTVKGPAPMPPPSSNPSAVTTGVAPPAAKFAKSGGGSAGGAGKDVLEGGDVDWVPPKDALEKMAALNKKFGY